MNSLINTVIESGNYDPEAQDSDGNFILYYVEEKGAEVHKFIKI